MSAFRLAAFSVLALALSASVQTARGGAKKTDAENQATSHSPVDRELRRNCPCPYNTDRRGRSCGRRSAYNRAGGASPLCYEQDVTQKMVDTYRKSYK